MCRRVFDELGALVQEGDVSPPSSVVRLESWVDAIKLVAYGVDTLAINVRYTDKECEVVKRELDKDLAAHLDSLQSEARLAESAVASPWSFRKMWLYMEPHSAGRQWRWLLTCPRFPSLVISRGKFNDVIAQVRLSSELLWTMAYCGYALSEVHKLLMSIFGELVGLQVSYVDLCADVVGYDFSVCNYEHHFVGRSRKQTIVYGADEVRLDNRDVSYLRFGSGSAPISCYIYNKTLEIKQKSGKTWFYDLWRKGTSGVHGGSWDGSAEVWRVECHLRREFFRNLERPIEGAYDVLDQFPALWAYAVGREMDDVDGWLRYVQPTEDSNRWRWPVHPAWAVVQSAFAEPIEAGLGSIVRDRVRQKNIERGLAQVMGYSSTLAAWLGGNFVEPDTDLSLVLHWLSEQGPDYLEEKKRDFAEEVRKKQLLYNAAKEQEGGTL